MRFYIIIKVVLFISILASLLSCTSQEPPSDDLRLIKLKAEVTGIVATSDIDFVSVSIVDSQRIILHKNFSKDFVETKSDAFQPFILSTFNEFISTVLVLQLIQEGTVQLNDRLNKYGLPDSLTYGATVKKLLTYTLDSGSIPKFNYEQKCNSCLNAIIEKATGKSFAENFNIRFKDELDLKYTVVLTQIDRLEDHAAREAVDRLLKRYSSKELSNKNLIITSQEDVSKILIAVNKGEFFNHDEVFKSQYLKSGRTIPFGLGWFIQSVNKNVVAWCFGEGIGSFLVVTIVPQKLTFIAMSNKPNLNSSFPLSKGNIFESALGLTFLRNFIYDEPMEAIDYAKGESALHDFFDSVSSTDRREFYLKELVSDINLTRHSDSTRNRFLKQFYVDQFPFEIPVETLGVLPLARIDQVKDRSDIIEEFFLERDERVRVFGFGEFLVDYLNKPWMEDNFTLYLAGMKGIRQFRFNYSNECISGNYEHFNSIQFKQMDISSNSYDIEIKLPFDIAGVGLEDTVKCQIVIVDRDRSGTIVVGSIDGIEKDISKKAIDTDLIALQFVPEDAKRNVTGVAAYRTSHSITIDGKENEWLNVPSIDIMRKSFQAGGRRIILGNAKITYDDEFIYLFLHVNDRTKIKAKALDFDADYGWIADDKNRRVWTMSARKTKYGGGAFKNRYVDTLLNLPKGIYTLHYVTDDGSSFSNWSGSWPECSFYGIGIYPVGNKQ